MNLSKYKSTMGAVRIPYLKYVSALVMLLFTFTASAQFSVSVLASTPETCPGNGTMTLGANNADPGAAITYQVYLLPNTTSPVWNNANPNVTALADGNYQVTATQTVGTAVTVSAPQQVTIGSNIVTVTYGLDTVPATCGPDGEINITVTGGTAVSYEIISGPVTRPPQPDPLFEDLPAGSYIVRVNDPCGFGVPQTIEIGINGPVLELGPPKMGGGMLPACDEITLGHQIFENTTALINYPINVTVTLYPPGGGPALTYTTTITAGDPGPPEKAEFGIVIPFYYDQPVNYHLVIDDGCTVYESDHTTQAKLTASIVTDNADCDGKKLVITVNNFGGSYSIEFDEDNVPAGFNPADFNAGHPGPFVEDTEYGEEGNSLPYGDYGITITDECGRSVTQVVTVEEIPVIPVASGFDASCGNPYGYAEVSIPGKVIVEAYMDSAPDEYWDLNPVQPFNLVVFWVEDDMMLVIPDLPPGDYVITLIDECGVEYPDNAFNVDITAGGNTQMAQRPDCAEGKGTMAIVTSMPNSPLTEVLITVAPPEFITQYGALPFDASAYIYTGTESGTGNMYMDNLPPGYYEADATGSCGTLTVNKTLVAYSTSENIVDPILHCGSFDVYLKHTSTGTASNGFFLQKYDEGADTWGHPDTGAVYPEDESEFTDDYGIELINNGTVSALPYNGTFRVVKAFTSYPNGMEAGRGKWCYEIIEPEFIVPLEPQITGIINISCDGESADVQVGAIGVEPLIYKIIEKNGQPFFIDNGTSNTFYDLEAATYKVTIEDPCGYIYPEEFNVNDLPSLVNAYTAPNLEGCDTGNDNEEEFDLSEQTPFVLGAQDPDQVTITYHDSQGEAEDGINPLPLNYVTGNTTVYARATHELNLDCIAITSFTITLQPTPELNMEDYYAMCEGESVTITADPGYSTYLWSTGDTTESITTSTAGIYTVDVTSANGCPASKTLEVVTSAVPHISVINIEDWSSVDNTITVVVEPSASPQEFEYSLDGFNYQESPVFTGLPPGPYMVYVRDVFGCGMDMGEVFLLTYPKFFTPNQDGINDKWRIEFSYYEPDMEIFVYDRFGKLILSFGANSEGWDGTYNGVNLPSTDYWFVVKRQNGQEMKGHFSMVR